MEVEVTVLVGKVVWAPLAFQRTCEPPVGSEEGIKLEPLTVRVTAALPGAAEVGEIEERTGRGFAAGLMMKVMVLESPLLVEPECGLRVLTGAVPAVVMSDLSTLAVT